MAEITYSRPLLTMSYLNFHLRPLYAAITLLGVAMPVAHSVTLGELQLQSYVGQHFRGSVPYRLNAGETLNEQCIELQQGNSELPNLGAATIQLRPSTEQSGVFVIESRSTVGEPTVAFAIKVACGNQQITRNFTAFLNIAPVTNERETLTRFAVRAPEKKLREVESTPLKEIEEFVVKNPISLKELTKRYYPANTPQYPRYLQKLSNTNPELDPNAELSTGTTVIIPERLRSVRKKPTPVAVSESGQLRLDAAVPSTNSKPITPSAAQYTKDLEQKVKMLEDLQLQMQVEVEQLNQKLSQLNAITATASQVATVITSTPIIASAAIAPSRSVTASTPIVTTVESKVGTGLSHWLIGLGLALLVAIAAFLFWRRRQSTGEQWSPEHEPTAHTLRGQLNPFTKRSKSNEHATIMSMLHTPGQGIEVNDYSGDNLARVQIMLAHGEVSEAIDLLYKCIDDDPEDIERWLMLFRVFRQQGMRTEYAALAKNLRLIVKDEADWELVRNIGAKLDPDNHLYRRTENPLKEVAESAIPSAPHVDLDIHPETTPASAMHAYLASQTTPVPIPAFVAPAVVAPMDEILLDIHLPDVTGNQIQDHQILSQDIDAVPVFEFDLLPPFDIDTSQLEWDEIPIELDTQEPKPAKPKL